MIRILIVGCGLAVSCFVHAEELTGTARVLDGDTIELRGKRIRLEGIDAPETRQQCERSYGSKYRCGRDAMTALRKKISGRRISCSSSGRDRYGRTIATCSLGKTDLNRWMVRRGHAVAYRRYSRTYVGDETRAKIQRRGIWQGRFVEPARWRRGKRLE